MSGRSITFDLLARDKSASKTFEAVGASAEKSSGRISHAFGALAMGGAFAAVAGIGAVSAGLIQAGKDASELQQISAQTAAALKSTGGAAGVTASQVRGLANEINGYSTLDDTAVQAGENLLLTFTHIRNEAGKGNDIFTQTTKVMADMSVALGQDTKSSALQLGKALNDPIRGVTELQRVGVSFTAAQRKQIKAMVDAGNTMGAQKLILGELNKEFGGSAKTVGNTFAGAWFRLKDAFQDTLRDFVGPLLPSATAAVGKLADLVNGPFVAGINAARGAVHDFVHGFTIGIDSLSDPQTRFAQAGAILHGLWANELLPLFRRVGPTLKAFVVDKIETFRKVLTAVTPAARTLWSGISTNLLPVLGKLGDFVMHQLMPAFQRIVSVVASNVAPVLRTAASLISQYVLPVIANIGTWITQKVLPPVLSLVSFFTARVMPVLRSVATTVLKALVPAVMKVVTAIVGALKPAVEKIIRTFNEHREGIAKVIDVAGGLIKVVAKVVGWLVGKLAPVVGWVAKVAFGILAKSIDTVIITISTIGNVFTGAWGVVTKVTGTAVSLMVRGFKFIIDSWLMTVGGILHGAAKAFGWVPGLGGKLKGAEKAFDSFAGSVDKKLSGIAADAGKWGRKTAQNFAQGVAGGRYPTIKLRTTFVDPSGNTVHGAIKAYASGGAVMPNKAILVGEKGPELFVPRSAGTIVPNGGGTPIAGGRGGGTTVVNLHVHPTFGADVQSTMREVVRGLERWSASGNKLKVSIA